VCLCQRSLPPVSSATFWHLPSTPHYCWRSVIPASSSGRETGSSHSERDQGFKEGGQITPSRNASAVLECEHLCADAYFHGGALHRMSALHASCSEWPYTVFFSVSQYTSDTNVVPRYMNSTISALFLSQKITTISFLEDNVCLNLFGLLLNVCVSTALIDLWFRHPKMKPSFNHLLVVRCDWDILRHLWGIYVKESKPKAFSAFCAYPWAFSVPILRQTCNRLA
jgi:hypothetical protein